MLLCTMLLAAYAQAPSPTMVIHYNNTIQMALFSYCRSKYIITGKSLNCTIY